MKRSQVAVEGSRVAGLDRTEVAQAVGRKPVVVVDCKHTGSDRRIGRRLAVKRTLDFCCDGSSFQLSAADGGEGEVEGADAVTSNSGLNFSHEL